MYVVRGLGGVLYLTGAVIMAWNLWMTVKKGVVRKDAPVAAPAE
jgi:cytochrome c oxidase cbb3-type subunit 1